MYVIFIICDKHCQDFGFQRLAIVAVSGIHTLDSLPPLIAIFSDSHLSVKGD